MSPASPSQDKSTQNNHEADDAKEWCEVVCTDFHERDRDVHSEHTADQVERHENRSEEGDLAKHTVGVGSLGNAVDRDRGQVIAVCSRQNLLEVTQVGCHGHNVILDVTKIHANVHTRRDLIVLVATLGEATKDISLATEEAKQGHAIPPGHANSSQE